MKKKRAVELKVGRLRAYLNPGAPEGTSGWKFHYKVYDTLTFEQYGAIVEILPEGQVRFKHWEGDWMPAWLPIGIARLQAKIISENKKVKA
jgi:hypothetical protein